MDTSLFLYAGFAGITVLIGGVLAIIFDHHLQDSPVKEGCVHFMMSLGAGIILSAVALTLIPEGIETLTVVPFSIAFLLGTVVFLLITRALDRKGGQTATLLAMMMDFVPESIALGAVFATDRTMATLLALFIGLQNLPEAFNSFRDLVQSGFTVKRTLIIFFFLSFFGIAGAALGQFFLSDSPQITALLMTFASGGILYLLVEDIIPSSKLKHSYVASLGASLGFLIGVVGGYVV